MDFWTLKNEFDKLSRELLRDLEPSPATLSHKEWLKQYNKAYYQKNKKKIQLKSKLYNEKNKDKKIVKNDNPKLKDFDSEKEWKKQYNKMYYENKKKNKVRFTHKWNEYEIMLLCRLYKQDNNITPEQLKKYFDMSIGSLICELKRLQYLHTKGKNGLSGASKLLIECYNVIN